MKKIPNEKYWSSTQHNGLKPQLIERIKRYIRYARIDIPSVVDKKKEKINKEAHKKLREIYSQLPKEWKQISKEILLGEK